MHGVYLDNGANVVGHMGFYWDLEYRTSDQIVGGCEFITLTSPSFGLHFLSVCHTFWRVSKSGVMVSCVMIGYLAGKSGIGVNHVVTVNAWRWL